MNYDILEVMVKIMESVMLPIHRYHIYKYKIVVFIGSITNRGCNQRLNNNAKDWLWKKKGSNDIQRLW